MRNVWMVNFSNSFWKRRIRRGVNFVEIYISKISFVLRRNRMVLAIVRDNSIILKPGEKKRAFKMGKLRLGRQNFESSFNPRIEGYIVIKHGRAKAEKGPLLWKFRSNTFDATNHSHVIATSRPFSIFFPWNVENRFQKV